MKQIAFKTLSVQDRKSWRSWLSKNHAKVKELWLVFYEPNRAWTRKLHII